MDDWMFGLVNVCVGCLLAVAWAYGRLSHARGPLPIGLRGFTPRQRPSRSATNKQPTHTFNQPCIHSSIHSTICPYTHPHIHSPTPSIHPPIHSPTPSIHPLYPFTHPSIQPIIHSFTHPPTHPRAGGWMGMWVDGLVDWLVDGLVDGKNGWKE